MAAVLAAALLLWIPFSYVFFLDLQTPVPTLYSADLSCVSGVVKLMLLERFPSPYRGRGSFTHSRISFLRSAFPGGTALEMMLHPAAFECSRVAWPNGKYAVTTLALPLWALAVLLLVWPITSWLFRQRRRRGFPIERMEGTSESSIGPPLPERPGASRNGME